MHAEIPWMCPKIGACISHGYEYIPKENLTHTKLHTRPSPAMVHRYTDMETIKRTAVRRQRPGAWEHCTHSITTQLHKACVNLFWGHSFQTHFTTQCTVSSIPVPVQRASSVLLFLSSLSRPHITCTVKILLRHGHKAGIYFKLSPWKPKRWFPTSGSFASSYAFSTDWRTKFQTKV